MVPENETWAHIDFGLPIDGNTPAGQAYLNLPDRYPRSVL
jgi:hypothetical protein